MLYQLLGEDQFLLDKSSKTTQQIFKISALVLLLNLIVCVISFTYIYAVIFHFLFFAILLSIFSTLIVYNIYKLCLVSIIMVSKKTTFNYIISFVFRVIFIGCIGLLVAQGFLIVLYDIFIESINFNTASILDLVNKTLNNSTLTIVFEPIIILLFLIPFFIKYFTAKTNDYGVKTETITKTIIEEEYKAFAQLYTKIFKDIYKKDITYKTNYSDAPFNNLERDSVKEKIGNEKDLRLYLDV